MPVNKNVLITGATSGIGEALFNKYSDESFDIIACGRQSTKLLNLKQNSLKDQQIQTLQFDMTNESQIKVASGKASNIDILIFNAGDCRYIEDVMQFDADLFADIINTNLISLGYLVKHFLPKLNKGGQLVFISSSAALMPFPRAEAYGASKAGVDYLANCLRVELKVHGIGVTLVHPGFIRTPLTAKNDFSMPFMLTAEEAAKRIFTGVKAKKTYLHFPKRLTLLLKFFRLLPKFVWQSLMTRTP